MMKFSFSNIFLKNQNFRENTLNLIVKIMKGDENFRVKSKAFLQSANEVFAYKSIIPYFTEYASETGNRWTANIYFADFAIYPILGKQKETILALDDLSSLGYRLSSAKMDLDEDHLILMAKKIAQYHALSFALKINNDPMLEKLVGGLIPFHFKSKAQGDLESYKYLCPISFERVFDYIANNSKHQDDKAFLKNISNLKKKVRNDFLDIMENFLKTDHQFAVILHGDYYRNNVMFQYETLNEKEVPVDLRVFDFQEIRYASIVIDLSIFMYMHCHKKIKGIWDQLLSLYHQTLSTSIANILKCNVSDERLSSFSFNNFIEHFKKFAFYGVAVSVLSIPWMAGSAEDTQKISEYFEDDMHNPDFKELLTVCGGEDINERLLDNVKHASDKGYLKIFE